MSTLPNSSRLTSTARAFSNVRVSSAPDLSEIGEARFHPVNSSAEDLKIFSGTSQFSATPRFRVLMAMEPAFENANEGNAPEFFENNLPDFGSKVGAASLNHRWEKVGFAINFIAIVTAIAYVVFT